MTNSREDARDQGKLWGGNFRSPTDPALLRLSRSPESYFSMAPYDIAGSQAHATELWRAGILTADELDRVHVEMETLNADIKGGALTPESHDEDVHGFIERVLIERLGELGAKLRAGRSRNDQGANDLRLYLRDKARSIVLATSEFQSALIDQAGEHVRTHAPGFTHLQPAQPIVFGHQLLAHAQSVARDNDRLLDWDRRSALSPLGAAALAGSGIAVHPEESAKELGYDGVCENSIDAVSSRDHVAEFLFATSMLFVNLSRLSEEMCLWVSNQFSWVELDDAFATGSSIMPQKKNPDVAELTRGKAGRVLGNMTGFMTSLKGLPLAYNRDLSEDKAAVLDTVETLEVVLPAMTGMIRTMRVNVEKLAHDATDGFTLATEIADWLSFRQIPFRESHEIAGRYVRFCEDHGIGLHEVSDSQLEEIDHRLTPEIIQHLTCDAALSARSGYGSTSPARVQEQLERLSARIVQHREWAESYKGVRA